MKKQTYRFILGIIITVVLASSYIGSASAQAPSYCTVKDFKVSTNKLSYTATATLSNCPLGSLVRLRVDTQRDNSIDNQLIDKDNFQFSTSGTVTKAATYSFSLLQSNKNPSINSKVLASQRIAVIGNSASTTNLPTVPPPTSSVGVPVATTPGAAGAGQVDVSKCPTQGILKTGSQGDCVVYLKSLLVKKYPVAQNYTSFNPKNQLYKVFDPDTEYGVFEWQKLAGITADGIVGKQTWSSLLCNQWDGQAGVCKDAATSPGTELPGADQPEGAGQTGNNCNRLISNFASFGGGVSVNSQLSSRCYSTGALVTKALEWLLGLAGMLTVLFIILGGYRYMTAAGNPEGIKYGKKMLQWALIGFVVVMLSYSIVALVTRLFISGQIF